MLLYFFTAACSIYFWGNTPIVCYEHWYKGLFKDAGSCQAEKRNVFVLPLTTNEIFLTWKRRKKYNKAQNSSKVTP